MNLFAQIIFTVFKYQKRNFTSLFLRETKEKFWKTRDSGKYQILWLINITRSIHRRRHYGEFKHTFHSYVYVLENFEILSSPYRQVYSISNLCWYGKPLSLTSVSNDRAISLELWTVKFRKLYWNHLSLGWWFKHWNHRCLMVAV